MADRPRIRTRQYAALHPDRIVVCRDGWFHNPWFVWIGVTDASRHATHAEAITAADKLAREQVGTVWTTPDSGNREDHGLIVG